MYKIADFGVNFALIGIENQQEIHYAMPLKVWKYDFLGYEEQLQRIKKMHRRKKDLLGAEYLAGFSKKDKLKPTLTMVLYYGKDYGIIYHSEKGKGTTASVVIPGMQEGSHERS